MHVLRDTEKLHLVVMNHEHIAGGSSVYEVINQYRALDTDSSSLPTRDRRFDVTLMINGLPLIHIELKNKQHSYMDAFYQIKKYIGEGKIYRDFFCGSDVCYQQWSRYKIFFCGKRYRIKSQNSSADGLTMITIRYAITLISHKMYSGFRKHTK